MIEQVIESGTKIHVVFGDRDRGCFQSSIALIEKRLLEHPHRQRFMVKIMDDTRHQFTEEIRSYVLSQIIN